MPVGGQTGEITPCATESSSPSLAAPTYAPATPANVSSARSRTLNVR